MIRPKQQLITGMVAVFLFAGFMVFSSSKSSLPGNSLNIQSKLRAVSSASRECTPSRTYHSSEWEELWINNVREWQQGKRICEELEKQEEQLRKYNWGLCASMTNDPSICVLDDGSVQVYYNKDENSYNRVAPSSVTASTSPKAVMPNDPSIFSYFEVDDCTCRRIPFI